jgi:hypothetical protein
MEEMIPEIEILILDISAVNESISERDFPDTQTQEMIDRDSGVIIEREEEF